MKVICTLLCLLLLTSCVYYGTSRDINIRDNDQATCIGGSSKDNEKCRAEIRKLNKAIKDSTQP